MTNQSHMGNKKKEMTSSAVSMSMTGGGNGDGDPNRPATICLFAFLGIAFGRIGPRSFRVTGSWREVVATGSPIAARSGGDGFRHRGASPIKGHGSNAKSMVLFGREHTCQDSKIAWMADRCCCGGGRTRILRQLAYSARQPAYSDNL